MSAFLKVLQIVNTIPTIISTVESVRGSGGGTLKRDDVKTAVLSTVTAMETVNQLTVKDRKNFNKGLDKVIDGVVGMLNASAWK